MSLISLPPAEYGEGLELGSKLHELQETQATKRTAELQARVARLRAELEDAEQQLEYEQNRWPEVGEFVRCPLTGFFGQVTKVTPRAYGRPWVEILLYLDATMPGHAKIDLFANWELIDPPMVDEQAA
ncbi:hypothetical protein [Microvirga sp. M2]|uniref:hypothetical protein n=1 Tax=Microvirga sp. M2 TaxID=3073270 RepID=UPI0039C0DB75